MLIAIPEHNVIPEGICGMEECLWNPIDRRKGPEIRKKEQLSTLRQFWNIFVQRLFSSLGGIMEKDWCFPNPTEPEVGAVIETSRSLV